MQTPRPTAWQTPRATTRHTPLEEAFAKAMRDAYRRDPDPEWPFLYYATNDVVVPVKHNLKPAPHKWMRPVVSIDAFGKGREYASLAEAAVSLVGGSNRRHVASAQAAISRAASGLRHTAFGYRWKYR